MATDKNKFSFCQKIVKERGSKIFTIPKKFMQAPN